MSTAPRPYKKAVGEGKICSQSTLRKRHCFLFFNSFSDFAVVVVVVVFFFAFGRAGEGLAERRGL